MRRRIVRASALVAVLLSLAPATSGSAAPSGPVSCLPPDPYAVSTQGLRFMSTRAGNQDVYETTADPSATPRDITNNPDSDFSPSAQANAMRIAFVSNRDG